MKPLGTFVMLVSLSVLVSSACLSLRAQLTFASGEITGAETWSGTVSVSGDVTVTSTGSLTILPGTRIEADWRSDDTASQPDGGGANPSRVELIVAAGGVLDAQGTEAAPIVFTVYAGDPPADVAAGDWYGLRLASDQVALRYCTVEYGAYGLVVEAGNPLIEHCVLQKNSYGMVVSSGLTVTASQSEFRNGGMGISGSGDLVLTLNQCKVWDNVSSGVYIQKNGEVTLNQCSVLRNADGVNAGRAGEALQVNATDTLISTNRGCGVLASHDLSFALVRCGVRANGAAGIHGEGTMVGRLEQSQVERNGAQGIVQDPSRSMMMTGLVSSVSYNGGNGIDVSSIYWPAVIALTNCEVVGNGGAGLNAVGSSVQLPVTGTLIASNQVGIVVQTQGAKVEGISGNDLRDNKDFELRNNGPGVVVATNNFWGEPTTTELAAGKLKLSKIRDSAWDASVGQVIIDRPPPPGSKEGLISGSETWSGTVTLLGDVTVTATGSLTILPGTRIQSMPRVDSQGVGVNQSRVELIVAAGGVLDAQGTEAAPIVFTVYAGDPPADVAAGDWYGLRLASDQVALRYCTVEYGAYGLVVEAGNPLIEHCVLQKNSYGMVVSSGLTVTASQSEFRNGGMGISGSGDLVLTLNQCKVWDNVSSGVYIQKNGEVTLNQCSVLRNADGVNAGRAGEALQVNATDTLISTNRGCGVLASHDLSFALVRCGVRANGAAGIHGEGTMVGRLEQSQVERNGAQGIVQDPSRSMMMTGLVSSVSYNGGNGIDVSSIYWPAVIALTDCEVVGNGGAGLNAVGSSVQLPVTGTLIASNQVGIVVQTQGAKVEGISGNDLRDNKDFELRNNGPGVVVATNNFWGEPTTTELAAGKLKLSKIRDSAWDASVGQVIIDRPPPPGSKEGLISGSETWSGTVTLLGDVTVTATGSLTILPGTRIQSMPRVDSQGVGVNQSRVELIVAAGGVLDAQGTEAAPIVFTVYAGDPPADVAAGDWYGLRLASDQVALRYCTVEYGAYGLVVEAGNPLIEHCVLQKNSYGMVVSSGLTVTASQSEFRNGGMGISGSGDLVLTLNQCKVWDNVSSGVYIQKNGEVTLNQCSVLRNADGVNAGRAGEALQVNATDTLISTNRGCGVLASHDLSFALVRCGVRANGAAGIHGEGTMVGRLEQSQVERNGAQGIVQDPSRSMMMTGLVSSVSYNGGNGIDVSSIYWPAVIALTDCEVVGNGGAGLNAVGSSVQLPVTGTLIASNQVGIVVQTQGAKVEGISGNDLRDNKDFELRNNGPGVVVATNNFWGEPTTTELNNRKTNLTKIRDSKDDASIGQVIVKPFSDECFACSLPPSVEISPALVVTVPGRDVTFTANATGTNPMSYEWQKLVDPVWVPIPGAGTAILELSEVAFADSGQYRVVVSNLAGTGIAEVTLTVADDDEPPTVVRAVGLDGASVALFFNGALDPQSATNASNYAAGPSQTVSSLALSADQQTVFLGLSGPAPADLQIAFQGVADAIGNPADGIARVLNFSSTDIGNPGQAGSAGLIDGAGVEASGGGADLGGETDSFQYLCTPITGDFDLQVRVADLTNPDPWAKAGLLVRASLAPGSRHYANLVTPADGKNVNFVQYRVADGQTALLPNELWRPCNYPNNWLRLQRVGSLLKAYVSGDGVSWIDLHQLDTTGAPYPDTVYVGFATTGHNDATRATARYADVYLQFAPPTSLPTIEITRSETGLTISWSNAYTSFVLQSTPDLAPPAWTDVTEGINSVGDKFTKSVDPVGERAFYRLIQR